MFGARTDVVTRADPRVRFEHKANKHTRQINMLCAYVTCRPDIGHAAITLSKFSTCPHDSHFAMLKKVAKHLRAADWQFVKERKQKLILQNNKRENAKRKPHAHRVGDTVVVKAGATNKHGYDPHLGLMRITQVDDNGTVKLIKVSEENGGAVTQTWNVWNMQPRVA